MLKPDGGSLRRVTVGLAGGLLLLVAFAMAQPFPQAADGQTYCVPFVGPRIRLRPGLPDGQREQTLAHEQVHAAQCRERGAVRLYWDRLRTRTRLGLEAEAGCAEAAAKIEHGRRPDYAFDELIDDLTYAVPRGAGLGPQSAAEIAHMACPGLAAQADSVRVQRARGETLAD